MQHTPKWSIQNSADCLANKCPTGINQHLILEGCSWQKCNIHKAKQFDCWCTLWAVRSCHILQNHTYYIKFQSQRSTPPNFPQCPAIGQHAKGRVKFLDPQRPLSKLHSWPVLDTHLVKICFLVPWLGHTGRVRELVWRAACPSVEMNHFILPTRRPDATFCQCLFFHRYDCYVSLNSVCSLRRLPGK